MRESAPAKVNLCLFLGPTRGDGRHELVSVMQSISLADELELSDWEGPGDVVRCEGVTGPNLATSALAAFREFTGWDGPAQQLRIEKRVPVAAGLGGGSGDAAAALRLVARRAGMQTCGDEELLLRIGTSLGADVPAQVRPGRVLATGAGELLHRMEDPDPFGVLVLPSHTKLATPDVFAQADRMGLGHEQEWLEDQVERVLAGELLLVNELAPAAIALEPSIGHALRYVESLGASTAMVSGSGPTVFGLFEGEAQAAQACARARGDGRPAHVAVPVNSRLRHN